MRPMLLVTLYCTHTHASMAAAPATVAPSSASSGALAVVPSATALDYALASGATLVGGPRDASCGGQNIRSGRPGGTSQIRLTHPLFAPGMLIDSLSLNFRYTAGYTPSHGHAANASVVTILLTDANGSTLSKIFTSVSYTHLTLPTKA